MGDDDVTFGIFVLLILILFFAVVIGITISNNVGEIRNILKSEGSAGNFTDEDLEKIREIIVK